MPHPSVFEEHLVINQVIEIASRSHESLAKTVFWAAASELGLASKSIT